VLGNDPNAGVDSKVAPNVGATNPVEELPTKLGVEDPNKGVLLATNGGALPAPNEGATNEDTLLAPNEGALPAPNEGVTNEGALPAPNEGATKEEETNEGPLAPKVGITPPGGKLGAEFDPKEALVFPKDALVFLNGAEPKGIPPVGWFPKVNPACVVSDPNTKFGVVDPNVLLDELSKEKPLDGCEAPTVPKLDGTNVVD